MFRLQLNYDQIQKEFEELMADESCGAVNAGKDFWNDPDPLKGGVPQNSPQALGFNPPGAPIGLKGIPSYTGSISEQYAEQLICSKTTNFAGQSGNDNTWWVQWVDAAFNVLTPTPSDDSLCDDSAGATSYTRPAADFGKAYVQSDGSCGKVYNGAGGTGGQCVGVEESAKKMSSYGGQRMQIFQEMQRAIDNVEIGCIMQSRPDANSGPASATQTAGAASCTDAVNAWDSAVAYYVGSIECDGTVECDGLKEDKKGKTLYSLAKKRCDNFKTCGPLVNDPIDGKPTPFKVGSPLAPYDQKPRPAPNANTQIISLFSAGVQAIYAGDVPMAKYYQKQIAAKLLIGNIQGTIRYGFRLSNKGANGDVAEEGRTDDKFVGEGSTFAMPVMCHLWACSRNGYNKGFQQIETGGSKAGKGKVNIEVLRLSFECNYRCLGLTCKEIGTLYDSTKPSVAVDPPVKLYGCDDADNGTLPSNVAKCVKFRGQRKQKCQAYTGNPGIVGRDAEDYFVKEY